MSKLIKEAKKLKLGVGAAFEVSSYGISMSQDAKEALGVKLNNFEEQMNLRGRHNYKCIPTFEKNTVKENVLFFAVYKNGKNTYTSLEIKDLQQSLGRLDNEFAFLTEQEREDYIEGYKEVKVALASRKTKEAAVTKFNETFFNGGYNFQETPCALQSVHCDLMGGVLYFLNSTKLNEDAALEGLKYRIGNVKKELDAARKLLDQCYSYSE